MKVRDITVKELAEYLRLEFSELTAEETSQLETLLNISINYIKNYTGLTMDEVDEKDEFVIVVYILVQDMYDNRKLYIEKGNLNKVVDSILGMHSVNLL